MTDVPYRRGAGRGFLRRTATVTAVAVSFLLLLARSGGGGSAMFHWRLLRWSIRSGWSRWPPGWSIPGR